MQDDYDGAHIPREGSPFRPRKNAGGNLMKLSKSALFFSLTFLLLACAATILAQWQTKSYHDWTEQETAKVLNHSPWGQTQSVTDTSKMFGALRSSTGPTGEHELPKTDFHIRFFSARPIRQAISRSMELKKKGALSNELAAQLKALAEADFPDYVIITVVTEFTESGTQMGSAGALLDRQITLKLKNDTYLSVKGGKRVFLQEYQPPRKDGLGARFIFPRVVDGKSFITPDSGEILFYSQLSDGPALSMRFKVKDMIFADKLEY